MEEESGRRNHGGGIIEESIMGSLGGSHGLPGGSDRLSGALPGGSPGLPGGSDRLSGASWAWEASWRKMSQNHRVFDIWHFEKLWNFAHLCACGGLTFTRDHNVPCYRGRSRPR